MSLITVWIFALVWQQKNSFNAVLACEMMSETSTHI